MRLYNSSAIFLNSRCRPPITLLLPSDSQRDSKSAVRLWEWWRKKGASGLPFFPDLCPSWSAASCGTPACESTGGATAGRLWGTDKMEWKSDFPYALFLGQTPLRSLTEEEGGRGGADNSHQSRVYYTFFCFSTTFVFLFSPAWLRFKILPLKFLHTDQPQLSATIIFGWP